MLKLVFSISLCVTLTHAGLFHTPRFIGPTYAISPVPQFASAEFIVFEDPLYIYDTGFTTQQQWNMYPQNQQWAMPQQNSFAIQNFQPINRFPVQQNAFPTQPLVNNNQMTPGFTPPNPPINNVPVDNPAGTNVVPSPVEIVSH